ncbi:TrkH family potassium uptake protein [uncultured Ruthenibacterium sp.]|uniref:TrkH family potassium uptake protein n=1 Tax=uncultured Ruthenibacterium sp. TaxID=1905347 RepID=UPI00349E5305
MFSKFTSRITPAQIIILGFLSLILAGTLLLMLPVSTRGEGGAPFLDALFTATSATCVTGLILHDTYTYWSEFGQLVILGLIQVGGMGVVTMAIAIAIFSGKRIGLRQRFIMQESISAPQVGGIVRMTDFILKTTFAIEGLGALILALRFCPEMGVTKGIWYALFHAISAFCNAGFDLMGFREPSSSLVYYVSDPIVNIAIMLLIICGGIGFFVWSDVQKNKFHFHHYRLQTKIVLTTTSLLLLFPALFLFLFEFSQPQWADLSLGQKIWASIFQSVTPRTAGFNTVNYAIMSGPGILLTILLMLIGGSPGSTAGGTKTTSLAMVFLCIRSVFQRRDSIQCFGRRVPPEVLRSTCTILTLYAVLFLSGSVALCLIDDVTMSQALFECASAIGTVGLSTGITAQLSAPSQLILIFLMYFGRVGGLTLIYAVASGHLPAPSQMPQEKIKTQRSQ